MTCHLFTAGRLPAIGNHLLEQLRARLDNETIDLFDPLTIHVSDRLAGEWLRLHLSTGLEGRADLRFESIDPGIRGLLAGADDREGQPLDRERIGDLILSLLLFPAKDEINPLEQVWNYLYGTSRPPASLPSDKPDPNAPELTAWWRRASSLATTLADLFVRYEERGCPGDLAEDLTGDLAGEHAPWQSFIYEALFRKGGRRDSVLPGHHTLRQVAAATLAQFADAAPANVERRPSRPPVFIFASPPSPLQIDLLVKLGQSLDLTVYLLAPGLPHVAENRFEDACDSGDEAAFEPPLAWNRSLREALALFASRSASLSRKHAGAIVLQPLPEEPAKKATFLQALQGLVATGTGSAGLTQPISHDRSFQVIACPGLHREAETIVQMIAGRLARDPVPFNDTAVLFTESAALLPLREAFQAAGIPVALGACSTSPGPFAEGIEDLWTLAAEGFSRQAVFRLLGNPCWQAANGADPGMVRSWLDWAETMGISFGFATGDKCRQCELPGQPPCDLCMSEAASKAGIAPTPAHTWQLALRRLRLGRIMETNSYNPVDPTFPAFAGCAPYRDFASSDEPLLEAFSLGIETLERATEMLRSPGEALPVEAWATAVRESIDLCLGIRSDHPQDALERNAAIGRLHRLALMRSHLRGPIPFGLVRETVTRTLSVATGGGSLPLFGGVALLPLGDGCRLPFRDIYVVGLGEKQFPGSSGRPSLDLLPPSPRDGDELQRLSYLQLLLSPRERLVITYSNLDPAKEALLNPSSVLVQTCDLIREKLLLRTGSFPIHSLPGTILSSRYLSPGSWPAGIDPLSHLRESEWLASMLAARHAGLLSPEAAADIEARAEDRLAETTAQPQKALPSLRLGIDRLVAFLRDPASALADRLIRSFDEENDEAAEVDGTPLVSDYLKLHGWLTRALRGYVQNLSQPGTSVSPADFFDRFFTWESLCSRTPDGVWGLLEKGYLQKPFEDCVQVFLEHFLDKPGATMQTICIGRSAAGNADRVVPPVPLRVAIPQIPSNPSTIELVGRMPLVWRDEHGFNTLAFRMKSEAPDPKKEPPPLVELKHFMLTPLLSYLALLAGDADLRQQGTPASDLIVGGRPLLLHVCSPSDVTTFRLSMSESGARDYLTELVQDYFSQSTFDDLRLKAVMRAGYPPPRPAAESEADSDQAAREQLAAESYREKLEDALDTFAYSPYPPTFDSDLFKAVPEPAIPADARDKVMRRFLPLIPERVASHGGSDQ